MKWEYLYQAEEKFQLIQVDDLNRSPESRVLGMSLRSLKECGLVSKHGSERPKFDSHFDSHLGECGQYSVDIRGK